MLHNIFRTLKKRNVTFFGKVRIVTQSSVSVFNFTTYFPENVSSAQSLSTKYGSVYNYHARFFANNCNKFLSAKNRGKAFSVSSENMLHTTSPSFHSVATFGTDHTNITKILLHQRTFLTCPSLAIDENWC